MRKRSGNVERDEGSFQAMQAAKRNSLALLAHGRPGGDESAGMCIVPIGEQIRLSRRSNQLYRQGGP